MTDISYHGTVNDLQGLHFAPAGPFARPDWFALLQASSAPALFAAASDASGTLVLPLTHSGNVLKSLTNWYAFSWQPLATPHAETPGLLRALAHDLKARAASVDLAKLPEGSARAMQAAFAAAGWITLLEPCDSNHVLRVTGRSYADYLGARPGPLRTTLKRRSGKVDVEIVTDFEDDAWDSYQHVYAHSWKPGEGDPALLRAFAEAEGSAGRLRLGLARHEGQVVAAQFWTVENDTAWIHKLAHLESARHLSAGTVLSAALFRHVIDEDRVALVDFGTGDDGYKRDWMEQVRTRYRLRAWRPGAPANWPRIARAKARALVSRWRAG